MKYLAYGANMNKKIMQFRCPDAKLLGTGELENFRLMFKGEMPYSYATIEEWNGFKVPYVLWEITLEDEKKLDKFEGFPIHYQKRSAVLEFCNEKIIAMFYQKDEKQSVNPPMTHYYAALVESYETYGFDLTILKAAFEFSDSKLWE